MIRPFVFCIGMWLLPRVLLAGEVIYEEQFIFDPAGDPHGHVHASAIVECPNGDLRAVWYENGTPLPSPRYFNAQQDKSSDVRIGSSRRAKGATTWGAPFVISDTFGTSDNNPTMVIDAQDRLWLVHSTMIAAPEWTWGSSMLRYWVSSDYAGQDMPRWDEANVLLPHPLGFEQLIDALGQRLKTEGPPNGVSSERAQQFVVHLRKQLDDPAKLRLGWMPRAHPLIRSDGALILPLSNENFDIAMMAITSDGGRTWQYSEPVPDVGVTQPTLVELADGRIDAYFRNDDPAHRIKRGTSHDGGLTWSKLELTELPHPGAGIEVIRLANGHLALVYNNVEDSPRDKLAISLSDDEGRTWKWTRQLEDEPGGRFDYPSLIQAEDGSLHVTYSYHLRTIKHVRLSESWVQQSDGL
ncbi:MAG: sialidase family protein [Pirellulales bacterium]